MSGAPLTPLTAGQRKHFDWLAAPHLKKVIDALEAAAPASARYVGGCVRDSLFGAEPKDFDVATTLTPERVVDALASAGLRSAPTGIEHGTVTAIADHQGVEVTTLRADVSTDGRRATVAFATDWVLDAGRRDFTINAIYLTPAGDLFDPVGGLADIAARRVRFIGDPARRIEEDYLRILRFFRFTARFAETFDPPGLAACTERKAGVGKLSAERVGAEFLAILSLPRAVMALEAMRDSGVLAEIWPAPAHIAAVERLKRVAPGAAAPVALAALYGEGGEGVGSRLRLSNAEKAIRSRALALSAEMAPNLGEQALRVMIYRCGKDVFQDAAAAACAFEAISAEDYRRMVSLADGWAVPVLSVSGRHIVDRGVPAGPSVARILAAVERRWIAEDFPDEARTEALLVEEIARAT